MKLGISRSWLALFTTLGLLVAGSSALAQTTHKFQFQAPAGFRGAYKQQHEIEVGDGAGHKIRVAELHTDFSALGEATPTYAGVRAKETYTYLSSDYTAGNGTASGYAIVHLQNGDRIFQKLTLVTHTQVAPDGRPVTQYLQIATLTGGTGKFKGIRGLLRSSGSTDFKTGVASAITEGSYYFVE